MFGLQRDSYFIDVLFHGMFLKSTKGKADSVANKFGEQNKVYFPVRDLFCTLIHLGSMKPEGDNFNFIVHNLYLLCISATLIMNRNAHIHLFLKTQCSFTTWQNARKFSLLDHLILFSHKFSYSCSLT